MAESPLSDTLQTSRLVLRPFEPGDAEDVARMAGDPRLSDTLYELPRPYQVADALEWIGTHAAEREAGRRHTFAVCLGADGSLVGSIALRKTGKGSIRAELGYWTGVEHWSCGYASEAARAVIAFGFDSLGLERVEARHLVRNPASGRVMHKAGMQHEATLRAYLRNPHTRRVEDMEQWSVVGPATLKTGRFAPDARPQIERVPGARIATVALLVRDYDEARDWFVDVLDFRLVEDQVLDEDNKDGTPKRWLIVEPRGGGLRLLLARASSTQERAVVGQQGGGRVWLFLETDDFALDHSRFLDAGVRFDEASRHEPYGIVAVFRDLYGNAWDLIEPTRSGTSEPA